MIWKNLSELRINSANMCVSSLKTFQSILSLTGFRIFFISIDQWNQSLMDSFAPGTHLSRASGSTVSIILQSNDADRYGFLNIIASRDRDPSDFPILFGSQLKIPAIVTAQGDPT